MAIKVKGSSKNFSASSTDPRKVTIGETEYDLSNIGELSADAEGSNMSTLTIANQVIRQGAAVDTRTVFEKAHSKNSGRYTFTIPFSEEDPKMLALVQEVSDRMEDICRSNLQKFSKEHRILADRDQLIRSEAYRRAKRDATYDREISEEERDQRIGDLMPRRKNTGRIDLQIRMSVRDARYDKGENSTAWRDTEVGRVGVYNQFGAGSLPLTNKTQMEDAVKLSEEIAKALIPIVAGEKDLMKIWTGLAAAVKKLPIKEGYDREAQVGYTAKEEERIEELKLQMIAKLGA